MSPATAAPTGSGRRFRRASDVLVRQVGPVYVLLNGTTPDPIVLEGPAAALWSAIDDAATADEIAARLAQSYGADPVVVGADIAAATAELARLGLVVESV